MSKIVNAQELRDLIDSNKEMALIDVREAGIFTEAHLFFARSLPLSKIELNVETFLPRKSVTIIVMDAGDDNLSTRAERVLKKLGYVDVAIFSGGLKAWRNAGFEIFTGANVPSKAFGEFIETSCHTPRMPAQEIKAKIGARENMIILDSRPFDEYHRMNIPGSINVPGAELVYRINDLIPDPDTLVVVNCAGRTRSIIGTQSLINAGIKNEVVALKDGTMGWHLAGFKLEHGQNRVAPAPSEKGLEAAKKIVEEVTIRFDIQTINQEQLENYRQQSEERSLYLLCSPSKPMRSFKVFA